MRWLGRAVYDQVEPKLLEKLPYLFAVAYVNVIVFEILRTTLKAFQIPFRVTLWTKENTAHVVINTDHLMALRIKVRNCLRTYEAAAACNKNSFSLHFGLNVEPRG